MARCASITAWGFSVHTKDRFSVNLCITPKAHKHFSLDHEFYKCIRALLCKSISQSSSPACWKENMNDLMGHQRKRLSRHGFLK